MFRGTGGHETYLKEAFPTLVPALRHQQQPFLDDRRSFAVEDIRVDTQLLDQAKAAGYSTKVLFISTEDANLNGEREKARDNAADLLGVGKRGVEKRLLARCSTAHLPRHSILDKCQLGLKPTLGYPQVGGTQQISPDGVLEQF